MKKFFTIANIIMLTFILIFDIYYMFSDKLFIKTITSIIFLMTGIINSIYCINNKVNLKFPIFMIGALTCSMLGDILIELNFCVGTLVFIVAQIFYFISYCNLEKINRRDFILGFIISIASLFIILFMPFLYFKESLNQYVCCTYSITISFVLGKAISNLLKEHSFKNIIIFVGSILFFISDFMLVLELFGGISVASYLCHATYYPAQFLLAFSIYIYNMNQQCDDTIVV